MSKDGTEQNEPQISLQNKVANQLQVIKNNFQLVKLTRSMQ